MRSIASPWLEAMNCNFLYVNTAISTVCVRCHRGLIPPIIKKRYGKQIGLCIPRNGILPKITIKMTILERTYTGHWVTLPKCYLGMIQCMEFFSKMTLNSVGGMNFFRKGRSMSSHFVIFYPKKQKVQQGFARHPIVPSGSAFSRILCSSSEPAHSKLSTCCPVRNIANIS